MAADRLSLFPRLGTGAVDACDGEARYPSREALDKATFLVAIEMHQLRCPDPIRKIRCHKLKMPHIPRVDMLGPDFPRTLQQQRIVDDPSVQSKFSDSASRIANLVSEKGHALHLLAKPAQIPHRKFGVKPMGRRHPGEVVVHLGKSVRRAGRRLSLARMQQPAAGLIASIVSTRCCDDD